MEPWFLKTKYTVKPIYYEHLLGPKKVAVVDKWLLFRGHQYNKSLKWNAKMMTLITVRKWIALLKGQNLHGIKIRIM